MLMTFPFGLFICATIFDVADAVWGPALLGGVGYWIAVAGLLAAGLAAAAGMIDLWDEPPGATRRAVLTFNLLNTGMAALFLLACLIRAGAVERGASGPMVVLELVGLAVGAVGVRIGVDLVWQFDEAADDATTFDALETVPVGRATVN